MELLKVSANSKPNLVAGALVHMLKEMEIVKIQVIGAAALNQAIKAVAIARGYVAPSGSELYLIPSFFDVKLEEDIKTAIRLDVYMK